MTRGGERRHDQVFRHFGGEIDARLGKRGKHRGDHRALSVQLQFGNVLAGLAAGAGK